MTVISTYQPYFSPFGGFFEKAFHSDILVLMDTVQFPLGSTWLTRNRFKNDQGVLWIIIPVWKRGLGLQRICDVRICNEGRWAEKCLKALKTAYKNAPYFEDHVNFLQGIFFEPSERLIDLNVKIIRYLMEHMAVSSRLVLLSGLGIETKEPRLSVEVAKRIGANDFLAQTGAKKYLDSRLFQKEGIGLKFYSPRPVIYPQLWGEFLPNLSAFDMLFNCGPKAGNILRGRRVQGV
ncbi:WbqC-like family protein [uncultured Desulfobacterium sp.]|uniref:WbqC-like family protein n=1 Tax=uncultured Desulfobacterium sp. TaxID=201089 RepID=A0A445N232_9BACT|nr:WbqC-like family protein [uncultured Desulfobacterium sp.]